TLLDVAAPGMNTSSLNEFGTINTISGTSFAAPVVTGIAAELAAFDHTLSASDLKTLIVNGATNGGRTWGTVPIVYPYESLKLSAQRRGGRLCGNRLYTDSLSDTIYAERAGGQPEALGALSRDAARAIAAVHGGSAVYALTGFLATTGGSLS